ncbi:S8 family serine peptidase [Conexibacter sp. W3-3-2]|uniref:S8 family serine peptidase n=1 Tax=Conexibacter sp. W3-3-2 TaxID=2675227 RepID=UPI0012B77DF2|nr:S8 family serine peptidase [Conexibacter sp. W3-3-2]MTD47136.1 S8 family serine peptidase [Conexibacter sp. W3-3-2]MTD47403.1 S8 family serine peptidase [Conexibacter sp. W3-3-2]
MVRSVIRPCLAAVLVLVALAAAALGPAQFLGAARQQPPTIAVVGDRVSETAGLQLFTNPGEVPGNMVDDDRNGYVDDVHGIAPTPTTDSRGIEHETGVADLAQRLSAGSPVLSVQERGLEFHRFTPYLEAMDAPIMVLARQRSNASSQLDRDAVQAYLDRGGVVVASAGNRSEDLDREPATTPRDLALHPGYLLVGATDTTGDQLAWFSARGRTRVDLATAGSDVRTRTASGAWTSSSGTSFAAPQIAGLIARIAVQQQISVQQAAQQLRASARPHPQLRFGIIPPTGAPAGPPPAAPAAPAALPERSNEALEQLPSYVQSVRARRVPGATDLRLRMRRELVGHGIWVRVTTADGSSTRRFAVSATRTVRLRVPRTRRTLSISLQIAPRGSDQDELWVISRAGRVQPPW